MKRKRDVTHVYMVNTEEGYAQYWYIFTAPEDVAAPVHDLLIAAVKKEASIEYNPPTDKCPVDQLLAVSYTLQALQDKYPIPDEDEEWDYGPDALALYRAIRALPGGDVNKYWQFAQTGDKMLIGLATNSVTAMAGFC